jgi:hypothetical protein
MKNRHRRAVKATAKSSKSLTCYGAVVTVAKGLNLLIYLKRCKLNLQARGGQREATTAADRKISDRFDQALEV